MSEPLAWSVMFDRAAMRLSDETGRLRATLAPGSPAAPFPAARPVSDGWAAELQLTDGRRCSVINGSKKGLRRRHRASEAQLDGTRWVYRHTSDRRATITRNGTVVAKLHHPWQWGSLRLVPEAPVRARYTFSRRGTLDADDELMVTVFGVVLGPPGREGALGLIGQGLASVATWFT